MLTYQFEIEFSKKQAKKFDDQLELHRNLYNYCLELKKNAWQNDKINLTIYGFMKKEMKSFVKFSNSSSLQKTLRRLDKAYAWFFKNGGFPRFKAKNRFNTLEFVKGDGIKLKDGKVYIQHVSDNKKDFIDVNVNRKIEGEINSYLITRKNNKYFLNVCVENTVKPMEPNGCAIGIDFGISTSFTFSDGEKIVSPYWFKDKQKQISRLTRNENWKALNKVYQKIANKRRDFNHKLSRNLVNKYEIICIENLKVEEIKSEHIKNINKKLYNIGVNQIINFLKYKAENAGRKIVMVNPAYTTQTCHLCGLRQRMELNERVYKCACGIEIDRDENAALNILRLGLESLSNEIS